MFTPFITEEERKKNEETKKNITFNIKGSKINFNEKDINLLEEYKKKKS